VSESVPESVPESLEFSNVCAGGAVL
jgi:hypothetical protein